jgi:hypothetical protein
MVLLAVAALSVSLIAALHLARPASTVFADMPPPPDGYFQLRPRIRHALEQIHSRPDNGQFPGHHR